MYEIKSRRLPSQILTCFFSGFIFKEITISLTKATLQKENVIVEELDCIYIEDTENLQDSTRLVFIDEECGNFIVVNNGGEFTRTINQREMSDVLQ